MFDAASLQWLRLVFTSWLEHREREVLSYLIVEDGGCPTVPAAADVVGHVPESPLGRHCGADFFTTEVWTWRGLVTYYTGSSSHPEALFTQQVVRTLTMAEPEALVVHVLICDRDRKWSHEVRRVRNFVASSLKLLGPG